MQHAGARRARDAHACATCVCAPGGKELHHTIAQRGGAQIGRCEASHDMTLRPQLIRCDAENGGDLYFARTGVTQVMNSSIGSVLARIEADAQTLSLSTTRAAAGSPITDDDGAVSFGEAFKQAIYGVNEKDQIAAQKMADVDSGRSDDLVGAMLASQEASLSFAMLMQVRNKVVGALDDLLKLPL